MRSNGRLPRPTQPRFEIDEQVMPLEHSDLAGVAGIICAAGDGDGSPDFWRICLRSVICWSAWLARYTADERVGIDAVWFAGAR